MSEKRFGDNTWMEKRPYPGSRLQPFVSAGLLFMALAILVLFSSGDVAVQALVAVVFASIVFSVAVFPQYTEFTGMARTLAGEGVVKAKAGVGLDRFFPLFSLLTMLLAAPLLILFVSPQFFIGALVGIIVGFSFFQIAFTVYVRTWEQSKGVRISRYALVSEDERGRRVVHEYGLRSERSGLG